jgi:MraZ protein
MGADGQSGEQPYYVGEYRHGVDDKRRVQVPSKWRPSDARQLTLLFWENPDGNDCLRIMPREEMAKMLDQINQRDVPPRTKTKWKRRLGRNSTQVHLDKHGRICLPEEMARKAGITSEVFMVGLMEKFEIWSLERYDKVVEEDEAEAKGLLDILE